MTEDDPGILGNLPRSRPGRRSDKRAGAQSGGPEPSVSPQNPPAGRKSRTGSEEAAGRKARPAAEGAARPTAGARPRPRAAGGAAGSGARTSSGPAPAGERPRTPPAEQGLVSEAVHAAEVVAQTGLRVAAGIAGEALRRLTRR